MFRFGGFGFPGEGALGGTFRKTYSCYSVTFLEGKDRSDLETGGKIIMPPSALDTLTRLNIQYPMLFKLTNGQLSKTTHCGVLEFVADEGRIYLPHWMMENLILKEGDFVELESVSLSTAEYAKFQPQSVEFLDISNPKAVLERALRSFACLSQGDVVAISYNTKQYELCVLETKPGSAVSIIECDMNVEFAAPVGYKEPVHQPMQQDAESDDEVDYTAIKQAAQGFQVFRSQGNRLDGKDDRIEAVKYNDSELQNKRGIPNYNYQKGKITFIRNGRNKPTECVENGSTFEAFQGGGQNLREKKSKSKIR